MGAAVVANNYLRLEAMRLHKANCIFRAYVEREYNFFGFQNGNVNYDDFHWDRVGQDFLRPLLQVRLQYVEALFK